MTRPSAPPALLLFVGLLGALLGAAAAFVFQSPGIAHASDGLGPVPASAAVDVKARGAKGEQESLVAPSDGPARLKNPRDQGRAVVPEAVLRRGVSRTAAPTVEVAQGNGRVDGMVLDRRGDPIPDVSVFLVPPKVGVNSRRKASESLGGRDRTRSLDGALEQAAKDWAKSEGLARHTVSDDAGAFVFEGLPDRDFQIRAEAEGWRFEVDGPSLVRPGRSVQLDGKPLMSFTLNLVSSTGVPIREAVVDLGGGSRGWLEWSLENPVVRSTSARASVSAVADVYEDLCSNRRVVGGLRSQSVPLHIEEDGSTVLDLELEPDCVLTGRMDGSRHGFTTVFAVQLREGERFDPTVELRGHRQANGQSGIYVLSNLLPGRYAVGIQANDNEVMDHQVVEIVDGLNQLDLTRRELNQGRCVAVRAYAPGGAQLEDVSYGFEWIHEGQDRGSEGVRTFHDVGGVDMVDLDNFYSFDIDKWPDGTTMFLYASCTGFGKAVVPYRLGQREAEVRFEAPCELEVAIRGDIVGGGYAISIYGADNESEYPIQLRTALQDRGAQRISRSGVVRFRGLAPGPVTVKLERTMRWWGGGLPMGEQTLTLSGSEHRVDFQAPKLSDLSLVIAPAEKDRSVSLMMLDPNAEGGERTVMWGETNAEGRCVFRGIPPGTFTAVDSNTGARLEITAPSPEIRWDLTDVSAQVLVTVSRLDGKLAAWGFEGGDLILSMGEEPLKESGDILKHLHGEGATFRVLRGDEELSLEVPAYPRSIRKEEPLGGGFYIDRRR